MTYHTGGLGEVPVQGCRTHTCPRMATHMSLDPGIQYVLMVSRCLGYALGHLSSRMACHATHCNLLQGNTYIQVPLKGLNFQYIQSMC
jgi:hypothetical protein